MGSLFLGMIVSASAACSSTATTPPVAEDAATPEPTTTVPPAPSNEAGPPADAAPTSDVPRGQIVVSTAGGLLLVGTGGAAPLAPTTVVEAGASSNIDPSFLADGRILYAQQSAAGLSRVGSIQVIRPDGTERTPLVTFPAEGTNNSTRSPVVGADGRVYFLRGVVDTDGIRAKIMVVDATGGTAQVFASLPDGCESTLLTAAPGGRKLLLRMLAQGCRAGFALLTPGPTAVTLDVVEAPTTATLGFDETGTKLWALEAIGGQATLKRASFDLVPEGTEAKLAYTGILPARLQGVGPRALVWFGESSAAVAVSDASATTSELGKGEDWAMATFRPVP